MTARRPTVTYVMVALAVVALATRGARRERFALAMAAGRPRSRSRRRSRRSAVRDGNTAFINFVSAARAVGMARGQQESSSMRARATAARAGRPCGPSRRGGALCCSRGRDPADARRVEVVASLSS